MRDEHLLAAAIDEPWAITAPVLSVITQVLARRIVGQGPTADDLESARRSQRGLSSPRQIGSVAVLAVHGVILPRANLMTDVSGVTSFDVLTKNLRDAVATESVRTIVLDVDSPGGSVAGATEFAAEVRQARQAKPVIAVAHYSMNSAAYWLSAGATEIVAAPSSSVGSLGVYGIHEDLSAMLEKLGIKRTYISAGRFKVLGNETEPLSHEARDRMQNRIDEAYGRFVADVAEGRGVPVTKVRGGFGEGLSLVASEALKLGMVDRIGTLDAVIARANRSAPGPGRRMTTGAARLELARQDRAIFEKEMFELRLPAGAVDNPRVH